jgi:hypothetical protein
MSQALPLTYLSRSHSLLVDVETIQTMGDLKVLLAIARMAQNSHSIGYKPNVIT